MRDRLSLRARLLFAVGAITLVALVLADLAVYASQRSYLFGQVDAQLEASHRAIEVTLASPGRAGPGPGANGVPPGGPGAGASPASSSLCQLGLESAPGMSIEVRTATDTIVTRAGSPEECPAFVAGSDQQSFLPALPATITGFAPDASDRNEPTAYLTAPSTTALGPTFRVRVSALPGGRELVVAQPISSLYSTLSKLVFVEILVTLAGLLAALLLGLWLVRVGLRPLREVERTADAIADGQLMHRVPNVNRKTEVGHLAAALNVMLERIESAFSDLRASENRLRRFVADASHELRTPIAAVLAYAQLSRHEAAKRPAELERVMTGIERESTRMARLVEDLLTLARLDEGQILHPEPVELVGLAVEAIETARTVGPEWPIALAADDVVEVLGDRGALRQAVDNLISNVRAHTPPGTPVTVSVHASAGSALLEVADEGPGIAGDDVALVFERFFRADPSRSRETGGAGLGLAIVASIVHAHGGGVSAAANPGGGACFAVTLPLAASP